MFELVVSITASVLLLSLSVYVVLRERSVSDVALALFLFLLAAIEATDQLALRLPSGPVVFKRTSLLLEAMLPSVLVLSIFAHSRWDSVKSLSLSWWVLLAGAFVFPASAALFPLRDFFYSPDLQTERVLFLGTVGYWFYLGVMVYCVIGLVNLESLFSVASISERWRVKFEVIGVGSALSVLIFYFSQSLLYRSIDMNLIPVRAGVFIIASVLVGYSRFFRGNGVRISVSRYVFYRSLSLFLVGLYLLIVGLTGEGMRYLGESFSKDLAIFIAFTTGIVIFSVLFSERLRRRVKVLINKHFYASKHDYRSAWLGFTSRLTSCRTVTDVREVILETYRETFGLKGAALYLLDDKRGAYVEVANRSMYGEKAELRPSEALLSYFRDRERVFNPGDGEYAPTPEEARFVRITGARLLVPLLNNRSLEGFVLLGEQLAQEEYIYEDFDLMKTLARHATLALLNFKLSEELAETREVAAVARVSSFVIHDLKNLTSTLSLLLDNAEEHLDDPEFQEDMLGSIRATLTKMKGLIQKLRGIPEKQALDKAPVDISSVAEETIEEVRRVVPGREFFFKGRSLVCVADAEEIKKVLLNLLLNAVDAVGEGGKIEVEVGGDKGTAYIRVRDDGCGMSEDFMHNDLFRPFRTTKKKGLGIGLYQCRQIVEAHGGRIEVESVVGSGTVFTVCLPAVGEPALSA